MKVKDIADKYGFGTAQEALDKAQINTLVARYDYMSLLIGGLKEWLIEDEEERKRMQSVLNACERYRKHIVKTLDESYEAELVKKQS